MALTKVTGQVINTSTDVTVGVLTVTNTLAVGGTVSIGGTLTYEDVTNIDSVGLITARNGVSVTGGDIKVGSGITLSPDGDVFAVGVSTFNGNVLVGSGITLSPDGDGFFTGITTATSINVGSGITLSSDGNAFHTGIVTATSVTGVGTVTSVTASGIDLSGLLREGVKITAGKLSDNTNIDLENGMVHLFTTQETTTSTPNIRFSSSVTLNDVMQIGESIAVTIITTAAAGGYSAQLTIDGAAVTENWVGGSAPSDGGSSGVDIHAYTIIKTASATFTVIANQSKTS
tara:strand:- start:3953 stop:4816 length:864 start_codon:yes stop_codon:yes gene_type:complete